jgi:hypothetical protein
MPFDQQAQLTRFANQRHQRTRRIGDGGRDARQFRPAAGDAAAVTTVTVATHENATW